MGKRRLPALAALVLLVVLAPAPLTAQAARVLVLQRDGHVRAVNNPFLGPAEPLPAATAAAAATRSPLAFIASAPNKKKKKKKKPAPPPVTVLTVLAGYLKHGLLSASQEQTYVNDWNATLAEERHLSRQRSAQLAAETTLLHAMAVNRQLTVARLPVLFLTLQRNAQWWQSGTLLSYGARVQFYGDPIVWQYYPGAGIQLQVLGTFSAADAMFTAGPTHYAALAGLLNAMISLAVPRAGGLAWEYYFPWEGGAPGWVSAMAQGTAIEALTRGFVATGNQSYLQVAHQALPLLATAPPVGVGVTTPLGTRFVQYSFAPHEDIINAFLQTLIGLATYAKASGDAVAGSLYSAGTAQAQAELPSFNTGAWSLYEPGQEDDLSYHQLVTGFLETLCTMEADPIYCSTASAFQADLYTPPTVSLVTTSVAARKAFNLRFTLSKASKVGVVMLSASGQQMLYTSAQFQHGIGSFRTPALKRGSYTVKLSATDLAGNFAQGGGTLQVP